MPKIVLLLVTLFTTTLKEAILLPFDKETRDPCYVMNEEEVHMPAMKFHIIYGQHSISAQKKILENPKYLSLHLMYHFRKAHLLHKDVPMTIILKLARQQNTFSKEFVDIPSLIKL